MKFSTKDQDNDMWSHSATCATSFKGVWWHKEYHDSNLNGMYLSGSHTTFADGIEWRA